MSLSRLSRFASFSPSSFSLRSFSSSNAVKPFRILGVQQIALGSLSLSGLSSLWVDTFEAKEVKRFKSEKENVDEIVTEIGRGEVKKHECSHHGRMQCRQHAVG